MGCKAINKSDWNGASSNRPAMVSVTSTSLDNRYGVGSAKVKGKLDSSLESFGWEKQMVPKKVRRLGVNGVDVKRFKRPKKSDLDSSVFVLHLYHQIVAKVSQGVVGSERNISGPFKQIRNLWRNITGGWLTKNVVIDPLLLRNYAHFLQQTKGDHEEAEEYYSRGTSRSPGDGEVELHHDQEKASAYFERAVEADPAE
ncbi:hypothetical protein CTI12_AA213050 [Artemisia annua]|uniref:Uncharacterized protein n=1 Tax=Artemisia annua TaxID=35608 RepID=A0A2U1NYY8_ARTAN|nr:hypothetical protein CTI12_AA213050 [Artemisia annua]